MSFLNSLSTIRSYKEQILASIAQHRVTIIKGPTGCGKSTYIPHLLRNHRVAVIEPRRIAVLSLYRALSPYMDVGYKVRFSKGNVGANVVFMTDGAFINGLLSRRTGYDFIIVDEVHERNVRVDLILSMLKTVSHATNYILMSATADTELLRHYFRANVIEVKGKCHKAEIVYTAKPVEDYLMQSFLVVKEILYRERQRAAAASDIDGIFADVLGKEVYNRDVLVFVPGEEDVHELHKMVAVLPGAKAFKIFSSLSDKDQSRIFEAERSVKVIISTNICETSLTIPGIKYVIDTGLQKEKIFKGVSYFGITQVTRDSAIQRLGRCNRTEDGVCYRLYTESAYKGMRYSVPEILKSDLCLFVLSLLNYNIDVLQFNFITFPNKENMRHTLTYLVGIKSIEVPDQRILITDYGRSLLKYPLDVNHAHFYQCCANRNVAQLGAIVVSFISQPNYSFLDSTTTRKRGDLEELVLLFKEYRESGDKEYFCTIKSINSKFMEKSLLIYNQISGIKKDVNMNEMPMLKAAFRFAFKHNISHKLGKGIYRNSSMDIEVNLHPSDFFLKRNAQFIVYVDILCTNKNYARFVEEYEGELL